LSIGPSSKVSRTRQPSVFTRPTTGFSTVDFAWKPFFLSHAAQPDAKPLFARILTYYFLVMMAVFLTVSFFIGDIVKVPVFFGKSILPEPYWAGLSIIPVVMLGYVFLGISGNMSAGIYIEKKTHHLPHVTFLGAAVNIGANYALIPIIGIMGAALATLLSYAVMAIALYLVVQKFYPIEYEFTRMGKIAVAGLIVYLISFVFLPESFAVLFKIALLLVFLLLMYLFKFFSPGELKRLSDFVKRRPDRNGPAVETPTTLEP
jgi:O-antigen/teichoic acid export membrane protein